MGTALYYFVRVDGNPILASLSLIISAMMNIVLDWVFLAEMGMGIEGAAYATGISQSLILIILFSHFLKKDRHLGLTSLSGSWWRVYQGMANGVSEFANEISIGLTTLLLNWVMITRVGIEGVAALTIVNYLFFIGVIIFNTLLSATCTLVSMRLGLRNLSRIEF